MGSKHWPLEKWTSLATALDQLAQAVGATAPRDFFVVESGAMEQCRGCGRRGLKDAEGDDRAR